MTARQVVTILSLTGALCGCGATSATAAAVSSRGSLDGGRMMQYIASRNLATGDVSQVQLNRDFLTRTQRNGLRGIQFYNFCIGWNRNQKLVEPSAHDLDQLARWSSDSLLAVDSIDEDQKFVDPTSTTHQRIPLQGAARTALETERRALYAYQQRLGALIQARNSGDASTEALFAREDGAFVALMNSGYDQADHLLWTYFQSHCQA
jgi:hypothetical protein